ncbi:glycosyltransferase family 39 protein [Bacillus sp. NPDC077027]|uniref:glycosyltransferase family 39 protein n=1 Tax=Bacillus sp. NPDC077027 TaxID=3390548 RepID=UPI003D006583
MKKRQIDLILIAILLGAAILYTYQIWQDDSANQYYLAAVKSMTKSFHNFFFASFDASGFVTVDKPPVVLWIQTISALIFGVHTWSVILPQALAGVGSVWLLYRMIKPTFDKGAARVAALVMALTPIASAVSRTNNMDSMLVFTLLLGTYCLIRAVKKGKIILLLLAFALVGIGFNMKMLQAFMVLPAFLLFYLIAARVSLKKKLLSLMLSVVVLMSLSLSWALFVDYTSASNRPYVGSSQTNSVLELAFGYNGTERLLGQTTGKAFGEMNGGGAGMMPSGSETNDATVNMPSSNTTNGQQNGNQMPQPPNQDNGGANTNDGGGMGTPPQQGGSGQGQNGMQGGPGGTGGGSQTMNMYGTGDPGVFRLFQSALSGQISWMLPFALFGLLGMIISWWKDRKRQSDEMKETLLWTAWLVPVAGFFSIAGFFHHYYLIMLAPPIAALCGIGWYKMNELFKQNITSTAYLLPSAITVTALFQAYILSGYTSQIGSLWMYVIAIVGIGLAVALIVMRGKNAIQKRLPAIAFTVLLLTPGFWSATPMIYGGNSVLPEAGAQLASSQGGNMFTSSTDEGLLSYLRKNNTGEEYLFATLTTVTAAPYIIDADENVMALGGFNGTDPILTVSELKELIKEGKVKYFLLSGHNSGNTELVEWIQKNGTEISSEQYSTTSSNNTSTQMPNMGSQSGTLYEVSLND